MDTKLSAQFLDCIVDRVDVGVIVLDRDLNIHYWNQFMSMHSGHYADAAVGTNLFELFPDLSQRWFRKKIDSIMILKNRAFTSWQQRPYLFKFAHNRPVTGGVEHMYQNCTFIPLLGEGGEVDYVCITLQDVTDECISAKTLQATLKQLEHSSRIDGLTQLLNREHWENAMIDEFKRCDRYAISSTLIMFDLDHFKSINDTYGHLVGDQVLRLVSDAIRASIRETDIAGRYGGEEFTVIVTETSAKNAVAVAERIRQAVADIEYICDGKRIPISVSLGIAEFEKGLDSHEELIGRADTALYQAKESGRNRWLIYGET